MDSTEVRSQILAAYGISETDPDWIAMNALMDPIEADAKAKREHFEQVVLPARVAAVEAELNAQLPEGLTLKFL